MHHIYNYIYTIIIYYDIQIYITLSLQKKSQTENSPSRSAKAAPPRYQNVAAALRHRASQLYLQV